MLANGRVDAARSQRRAGAAGWEGWSHNPRNIYASALYANNFGGAKQILAERGNRPPENVRFPSSLPYVLNTHLAGLVGYLRLCGMAGETGPEVAAAERRLADLLLLRAALVKYPKALAHAGYDFGGPKWQVDSYDRDRGEIGFGTCTMGSVRVEVDPWSGMGQYNFTIDFVNLVPEVGRFLHDYAQAETREAVAAYNDRAPYWFASWAEEFCNEGTIVPLYDVSALFLAKAWAVQEPRAELEKWLDVPAFRVGDLFYMLNLIATLQAEPGGAAAGPH